MKMRAAVLRQSGAKAPYETSQPISVEEIELSKPEAGELLVRVIGGGLCHSDLSVINGSRPRPLPLVLGHEGAGEVVEVGPGIRDLKPGDPVVFQFSANCGRCRRCLEGRPQICEVNAEARAKGELMGGGRRLKAADGEMLAHHSGVSCFAEYAVIDRGSCVKVDSDIPLETAAIFGCAVMTGVGAVLNTARIRAGDTVAVIGLGGVGLNGLLGAKVAGAGAVIAIDLNDERLGLARQLGATHTFNAADPNLTEQVRDITRGGVDFAFDFAGVVPALETGYSLLRTGGELVIAGLAPADSKFSFSPPQLVSDEKAIRGSYMGGCVPVRDIPRFIDLYRQGRLPIDALISRSVGFEDINEGFDRLADGSAIRQILTPHAAA
ncbi:zinc-dependent alcohol dehydrogenase family protein [Nisaea sediminum]|uniref:zinc-dependent alcohol dehydrogenase family protein n=1 Tax=Nisaea sediminum TaxID=2775867 RepID=UPI001866D218|nr:zinc-dependent alcohol dehydrogenase family protein [Nisaea sediminum]